MKLDERYKVLTRGRQQEHAVAEPERVQGLIDAIDDNPDARAALLGYHIVSLKQLQPVHLLQLFRCSALLESGTLQTLAPLTGRILASTFIDDMHSRAQSSFVNAFLRLGGNVMTFGDRLEAPEAHGGELSELANLCSNYADVAVVRTQHDDSIYRMLDDIRIPVINAGNGIDEHPTNAMADLYTLFKWRPDLMDPPAGSDDGIEVAILSTPAQSRNVSSFLLGLTLFPHAVRSVTVFGRAAKVFHPGQREMLEQAGLQIRTDLEMYRNRSLVGGLEHALPNSDLIYVDRTRRSNMSRQDMIHALQALKPGSLMLHPQIREEAVSEYVDHSEFNGYFAQERHAICIRMALFMAVLGCNV